MIPKGMTINGSINGPRYSLEGQKGLRKSLGYSSLTIRVISVRHLRCTTWLDRVIFIKPPALVRPNCI
nr:MAG TPA: hypothetical protein [Bacteriophage sp.]